MRRFLAVFLTLFGILVVGALVVACIFWARLPSILSKDLTQKAGVLVQIDSIGALFSKITVHKLFIANVPNSILPTAFTAKTIEVKAPVTTYLSDDIEIEEIDLRDIYLGLEFDSPSGTKGNWTTIMSHLTYSQNMAAKEEKNKNRKVLIKKIIITDLNVDVTYKTTGKVRRLPTIDRMELVNVSSEGGFPSDQIMNSVLGEMLQSIFIKENMQNMLKELFNPNDPVQSLLKPFKGFFK